MKVKSFYVVIFLLAISLFSCIFPYPIFSNYTNITEKESTAINRLQETEISNISQQKTRLLDLNFDEIDSLIPLESTFEIIFDEEKSAIAKRIGGLNHFDIIFCDAEIEREFTTDFIPVIIKLNEYAYLPASLSTYKHGYCPLENATFAITPSTIYTQTQHIRNQPNSTQSATNLDSLNTNKLNISTRNKPDNFELNKHDERDKFDFNNFDSKLNNFEFNKFDNQYNKFDNSTLNKLLDLEPNKLNNQPFEFSNYVGLGHYCLHFNGSKLDGTNRPDPTHEKTIKQAKTLAKKCDLIMKT